MHVKYMLTFVNNSDVFPNISIQKGDIILLSQLYRSIITSSHSLTKSV